jgi:hypothetical protein
MTDWRANPRTGKSQFIPLLPEIKERLALGETYKQIHDDMIAKDRLRIGYDQFTRYIRKYLNETKLYDYDPAAALTDPESIAIFIADALETDDAEYIAKALVVVARAKGINEAKNRAGKVDT